MAGDEQMPRPIASPSVKQRAYERFQTALFEGKLKSGQLVSQKLLLKLLDLSMGVLRELLPRLESEGLVSVIPQRGIQITAIDLQMIREAFQMRAALEREATIWGVRAMNDGVLDEQRALHEDVLNKLEKEATPALLKHGQQMDDAFHNLLIRATRNDVLIQVYDINNIRIRLIRHDRIGLDEHTMPDAFGDHLAIIDAMKDRDADRAVKAMDCHITNAQKRALEL